MCRPVRSKMELEQELAQDFAATELLWQ